MNRHNPEFRARVQAIFEQKRAAMGQMSVADKERFVVSNLAVLEAKIGWLRDQIVDMLRDEEKKRRGDIAHVMGHIRCIGQRMESVNKLATVLELSSDDSSGEEEEQGGEQQEEEAT